MNKRKIFLTVILSILIVLTVAFIFGNSMKSKQESSEQSSEVYISVIDYLNFIFGENAISHNTFRKMAHFGEYFVLGLEVFGLSVVLFGERIKWLLYFLPIGLIVASVDETIQIFYSRGAMVKDVLLDFSGYLFSGIIYFIVIKIIKSKREKRTFN